MDLSKLNTAQYTAVTTTEGSLLILAGAGSGKTHSLIYRVAYLLEKGVKPEQILLLTFTNKAAGEMKERISKLSEIPPKIEAGTFHSFCTKEMRIYAKQFGIDPNFVIIDEGDCAGLIDMAKTETHLDKIKGLPTNKTMVNIISTAVNLEMTLSSVVKKKYPKYQNKLYEIVTIRDRYEALKREKNMLNYDDILLRFLELLQANSKVAFHIERHYRYIMVDEYQDTNHVQDNILRELRKQCKNLAVVGDDSQSLYGFRGADVYNILRFPERMHAKKIDMMQNYRSTQEILDLANHILEYHSTEGFPKHLFSEDKTGDKPWIVYPFTQDDEAEFVFREIIKRKRQIDDEEIAVLARNSRDFTKLELLLSKNQVPFQKYGGAKFLDRAHIKDITAYLRVLIDPKDELAWYRILQIEEGIKKHYSKEISGYCLQEGYEGLLNPIHQKRKYYPGVVRLYQMLQTVRKEIELNNILQLVEEYYVSLRARVIDNMKTNENHREEEKEALENAKADLLLLNDIADKYDNIPSLLDDLALSFSPSSNDEGVILSTIHSAKGLEFDTVFILDCVDGVFPKTNWQDAGSPMDNEEVRCMYVAVTRAKNHLILCVPSSIFFYGRFDSPNISHFIDDAHHLMTEVPLDGIF